MKKILSFFCWNKQLGEDKKDTMLPEGYKLVTDGKYYRWISDTGYMTIWDHKTKSACIEYAWTWYRTTLKLDSRWEEIK